MAILLSEILVQPNPPQKASETLRQFLTVPEIKASIKGSKNYTLDGTDPESAGALLFFQNSIQQTWLVRTEKRVYCILDDRHKTKEHVSWSIALHEVVDETGKPKIKITATERETANDMSGYLNFGDRHNGWLYSKKLFASDKPDERIARFLTGANAN